MWKRLKLDNMPETNVKIYCNNCSMRYNGLNGWVYKEDTTKYNQGLNALPESLVFLAMGELAKLEYVCKDCVKTKKLRTTNAKSCM